MFDTVLKYLNDGDWNYAVHADRTIARFVVAGEAADFTCYIDAIEEKQVLLFFVVAPNRVPECKRLAAAEYIARANFGLLIGNFELDMDTGDVRYRAAIDVEGGMLTGDMVDNLVFAALSTTNDYYGGLLSVVFADTSPADAIAAIEMELDRPSPDTIAALEASLEATPDDSDDPDSLS